MHSYCSATLTEVFPFFSLVVRQMPGYNSPRRGTARTLPKFLCCSVYCLFCVVLCIVCFVCKCVLHYWHRVANQLQLTNIVSYHICFMLLLETCCQPLLNVFGYQNRVIPFSQLQCTAGYADFPKLRRCQKGYVKQVPKWGSTNIRGHRIKCSRHGDQAPGICAPLFNTARETLCFMPYFSNLG